MEYLGVDGNLIFKMDLERMGWGLELDWSGSR